MMAKTMTNAITMDRALFSFVRSFFEFLNFSTFVSKNLTRGLQRYAMTKRMRKMSAGRRPTSSNTLLLTKVEPQMQTTTSAPM